MTLAQSIARHARFVAAFMDTMTLALDENPDWKTFTIEMAHCVRSKAEADKIIERWRGRPLWRNGVYMAEFDPSKLPAREGVPRPRILDGPRPEGIAWEIHFVPLITEQDAA